MSRLSALIVAGGIFLVIGVVFTLVGLGVQHDSNRLADLPLLTAAEIGTSNDGLTAAVDATIAERNDLHYEGLVAYAREEYRGEECSTLDDECESLWIEDERVTPPLWLDTSDGRLLVINKDYTLRNEPIIHQTGTRLIENETKVYRGFEIGNPVFVIGQVVTGRDSPSFHADVIYGGDSTSHLSEARFVGNVFFWLGIIFSITGLAFIISYFFIT